MRRTSIRACLAGLCLACMLVPAWAQKRLALVIGNSEYVHESSLRNPVNDAALMARTLRAQGFQVEERRNLGKTDMDLALIRFIRESAGADSAVVYYAGHGAQPLNGGRNYLLPVDAKVDNDDTLEAYGIAADRIVDQMERQANPAKLRLVVLDACRNNRLAGKARSSVRGLSRMTPGDDYTLIAFSTNDQDVAQDGAGANSPYAEALARHLARADRLPLRAIFEQTAADVRVATGQKQRPRTYGDLHSSVLLNGSTQVASIVPEPVGPSAAQIEQQAWEAAQRANTVAGYNAYLAEYPSGRFAAAARVARAGLQDQRPVEPPVTVGSTVKDCDECPVLVVLPAGSFRMGSPTVEQGRDNDEGPVHEVRIGYRLAVGKYEVSRGEFGRFVQATGYKTEAERGDGCFVWDGKEWKVNVERHWRSPGFNQSDRHPVVCVSWNDTQEYLKWLNGNGPGKGYRLLSEAEWEYAARAGQGVKRYPWGEDSGNRDQCAYANGMDATGKAQVAGVAWAVGNCADGHVHPAPGDALRANAFGLHHLQGNVWEWVQDVWHDNYSGAPTDGTAWTSGGEQARRVFRGGSWFDLPSFLRSANRERGSPDSRGNGTGFRIARAL